MRPDGTARPAEQSHSRVRVYCMDSQLKTSQPLSRAGTIRFVTFGSGVGRARCETILFVYTEKESYPR